MPLQATSGAASYDAFGGGAAAVPNYIEDMFQTWLYNGNGGTQTITNGIDLSGKGGLVWRKIRSAIGDHILEDTVRGAGNYLNSNGTNASAFSANLITSFGTTGFTTGPGSNASGATYASWTFREQPKFFDVVTWTGDGASSRTIAHNLGSAPGCVIVKCTSATSMWSVFHTSLTQNQVMFLNGTDAVNSIGLSVTLGATSITLPGNPTASPSGSTVNTNTNGATYVAYLFAHNAGGFGLTGTDNVISCGSFTTDGSSNATINLGYEPQWVLLKPAGATGNWDLMDVMRGFSQTSISRLQPNTSSAEGTVAGNYIFPTSTGFQITNGFYGLASTQYIYIAIRRGPMKVPTTGTSVFAPVTYGGTNANQNVTAGFPVSLHIQSNRAGSGHYTWDRLRGNTQALETQSTAAESNLGATAPKMDSNTGIQIQGGAFNAPGENWIEWFFQRAPGFFDEVCYTGTGSALLLNHNLGVPPELIITKRRDATSSLGWIVSSLYWFASTPWDRNGRLNQTNALSGGGIYEPASSHSATQYPVSAAGSDVNASGGTYVAYLFATTPGVSKVGLYTGTGTTQTINCGFTAGSRFVMIKRADDVGDWYVWDSARGIVAGNDPYLLLNSTAAEVTSTDFVDTAATGFELSSTAPAALNASGGSYIFLAIA